MIAEAIAGILIFIILGLPGILLAFAFLYNISFTRLEKTFLGIILGMLVIPVLAILEFLFIGLEFTSGLVIANSIIVAVLSLALMYKNGQLSNVKVPQLPPREQWKKILGRNLGMIVLIAILFSGFYARFATAWAVNFFEFDPIYYDHVTQLLVQGGHTPVFSDDVYYNVQDPTSLKFHRDPPLLHYLAGGWYMLYNSILGLQFDKFSLELMQQLVTPIEGALLSFIAYLLLKEFYQPFNASEKTTKIIAATLFGIAFSILTPVLATWIPLKAVSFSLDAKLALLSSLAFVISFYAYSLKISSFGKNEKGIGLVLLALLLSLSESQFAIGAFNVNFVILNTAVMALFSYFLYKIEDVDFNSVAIASALFFATTPQMVKKLGAGVSDQQPLGFFTSLILFAVYAIALNRKSYKLGIIAGFSMILSILASKAFIWPFLVIAAYIGIQSIIDFFCKEMDERVTVINVMMVAGALMGNVLMDKMYAHNLDAGGHPLPGFLEPVVYVCLIALGINLFLFALYKLKAIEKYGKYKVLAMIVVIFALLFTLTPVGGMVTRELESGASFANITNKIGHTIQEEGKTSESLYQDSYGVFGWMRLDPTGNPITYTDSTGTQHISFWLNPQEVLAIISALVSISAIIALWRHNYKRGAIALAAILVVLVFLNSYFNNFILSITPLLGLNSESPIVQFITSSGVFTYMLIGMLASTVTYFTVEKKNRLMLLFIIIIFPVSFIGLNKLKYMVHLSFVLSIAGGVLLGELFNVLLLANDFFSFTKDERNYKKLSLVLVSILAIILLVIQTGTVSESMSQLASTRISSDWMGAMQWLSDSSPANTRVLSWWDYGHWITFFGNRKSVLDPGNQYGGYDHEVAHAFVDGNLSDLIKTIKRHGATHVLVDSDLISKWGALDYLSGSCQYSDSNVCPVSPQIPDWASGPGRSQYEFAHYFDYLNVIGQCPPNLTPIQMPALQSSTFGITYCAAKEDMYILTQQGINDSLKRPYKIAGRDNITVIDENTSYLFPTSQSQFINVNPYIDPLGYKSQVINSAYTRLYFFESLQGFKLVYKSPNNQVKIFEYIGG